MATKSFPNGIERRNASPVLLTGQDSVTSTTARTVTVTTTGAVPIALMTSTGAPADVIGVPARLPLAATYTYDVGLTMTFTPKINGLSVGLSDTGAETVTYVPSAGGGFITVTINGGVSTVATLAVTWNASDAADVCSFTGDAGTIPLAAAYGPQELFASYSVATGMDFKGTEDGLVIPTAADADGNSRVRPYMMAVGAASAPVSATPEVGVTGRLPRDMIFTIDAGMTATVHPLVGGVSVVFTTAAAAAVSATGKVVTLTAKNAPALTDITAMNVLIAASASVSALIGPLTGTGADTFDAALAIAETPLWTTGTIPAQVCVELGPDGYYWPVERAAHDSAAGAQIERIGATAYADPSALPADVSANGDDVRIAGSRKGEVYAYLSRTIAGEDLSRKRLCVEERCDLGSGGVISATGTAEAAPCRLARIIISETAAGGPVTVVLRDGGAGGTVMTPTMSTPASTSVSLELDLQFTTDVHATIAGAGTASVAVYKHGSTVA